jgi:hypothetical protein
MDSQNGLLFEDKYGIEISFHDSTMNNEDNAPSKILRMKSTHEERLLHLRRHSMNSVNTKK